jgi:hypothetical protein
LKRAQAFAGMSSLSSEKSERNFVHMIILLQKNYHMHKITFTLFQAAFPLCFAKLGKVKLQKLSPQQLQKLYNQKLEEGYAPQTVKHIHRVLHRALHDALRW